MAGEKAKGGLENGFGSGDERSQERIKKLLEKKVISETVAKRRGLSCNVGVDWSQWRQKYLVEETGEECSDDAVYKQMIDIMTRLSGELDNMKDVPFDLLISIASRMVDFRDEVSSFRGRSFALTPGISDKFEKLYSLLHRKVMARSWDNSLMSFFFEPYGEYTMISLSDISIGYDFRRLDDSIPDGSLGEKDLPIVKLVMKIFASSHKKRFHFHDALDWDPRGTDMSRDGVVKMWQFFVRKLEPGIGLSISDVEEFMVPYHVKTVIDVGRGEDETNSEVLDRMSPCNVPKEFEQFMANDEHASKSVFKLVYALEDQNEGRGNNDPALALKILSEIPSGAINSKKVAAHLFKISIETFPDLANEVLSKIQDGLFDGNDVDEFFGEYVLKEFAKQYVDIDLFLRKFNPKARKAAVAGFENLNVRTLIYRLHKDAEALSTEQVLEISKNISDGSVVGATYAKALFIFMSGKPDIQKILLPKIDLSTIDVYEEEVYGAEKKDDLFGILIVLRENSDAELRKDLVRKCLFEFVRYNYEFIFEAIFRRGVAELFDPDTLFEIVDRCPDGSVDLKTNQVEFQGVFLSRYFRPEQYDAVRKKLSPKAFNDDFESFKGDGFGPFEPHNSYRFSVYAENWKSLDESSAEVYFMGRKYVLTPADLRTLLFSNVLGPWHSRADAGRSTDSYSYEFRRFDEKGSVYFKGIPLTADARDLFAAVSASAHGYVDRLSDKFVDEEDEFLSLVNDVEYKNRPDNFVDMSGVGYLFCDVLVGKLIAKFGAEKAIDSMVHLSVNYRLDFADLANAYLDRIPEDQVSFDLMKRLLAELLKSSAMETAKNDFMTSVLEEFLGKKDVKFRRIAIDLLDLCRDRVDSKRIFYSYFFRKTDELSVLQKINLNMRDSGDDLRAFYELLERYQEEPEKVAIIIGSADYLRYYYDSKSYEKFDKSAVFAGKFCEDPSRRLLLASKLAKYLENANSFLEICRKFNMMDDEACLRVLVEGFRMYIPYYVASKFGKGADVYKNLNKIVAEGSADTAVEKKFWTRIVSYYNELSASGNGPDADFTRSLESTFSDDGADKGLALEWQQNFRRGVTGLNKKVLNGYGADGSGYNEVVEKQLDNVDFIVKNMLDNPEWMTDSEVAFLARKLTIFAHINQDVATLFSMAQEKPEIFKELGLSLDLYDKIRMHFMEKLSPAGYYFWFAVSYLDMDKPYQMMSSTFALAKEDFKKKLGNKNIVDFINEIDPTWKRASDFLLFLSATGAIRDFVPEDEEKKGVLFDKMFGIVDVAFQQVGNFAVYSRNSSMESVDNILFSMAQGFESVLFEPSVGREALLRKVLDVYKDADKNPADSENPPEGELKIKIAIDQQRRMASVALYLIFNDYYNNLRFKVRDGALLTDNEKEVFEIGKKYEKLLEKFLKIPRKEWLEEIVDPKTKEVVQPKNVIRTIYYFQQAGQMSVTGNMIKAFGGVEIPVPSCFGKGRAEKMKAYEVKEGEIRRQYVLEEEGDDHGEKSLKSNVSEDIKNKLADNYSPRGHVYSGRSFFDFYSYEKFFSLIGYCWGANMVPNLSGRFPNGSFLGINGAGQGAVNDAISNYLDEAVASGIDNWSDAERYVMEHIDGGMVADGEVRKVIEKVYYEPYAAAKMKLFEDGHHKKYRFPHRNLLFVIIGNFAAWRRLVEGGEDVEGGEGVLDDRNVGE